MPIGRPRLLSLLLLPLALLLLAWPAVVNGGPFFHPDTTNYIRAADAGVAALTGHRTEWSNRLEQVDAKIHGAPSRGAGWSDLRPTRPVLSGRSIYYGAFLLMLLELTGRWGVVLTQASLALAVVVVICRAAWRDRPDLAVWGTAGVVAVLGTVTSLPFYISMMMPDVFTGLMLASLVGCLAFWSRLSRGERTFLILIGLAAVTFHTTHLLLVVVILCLSLLGLLARVPIARSALAIAPALLIAGIAAQACYGAAVRTALGAGPIGPPFLSARIIDGGPGLRYLRETCPGSGFALCRHRGKLPLDSDAFLWNTDPAAGVFTPASLAEKRRLGEEDSRFFRSVFAAYPVEVLAASARAGLRQAGLFGFPNFNYSDGQREKLRDALPARELAWVERSRAMARAMPTAVPRLLVIAAMVAGLAAIALVAATRPASALSRFAVLLVLAIAANTMICGALSKPHERYQMRVVWLLPFAALLLAGPLLQPSPRRRRAIVTERLA